MGAANRNAGSIGEGDIIAIYDMGRKFISKHTGLTGVEAGHIARKLDAKGFDFEAFDWKTMGEDLYGHGHRTGGVKAQLRNKYGVVLDDPGDDMAEMIGKEQDWFMGDLLRIHNNRSPRSIKMDLKRDALEQFDPTDMAGVEKWKKHPNRYDIIGIDSIPETF